MKRLNKIKVIGKHGYYLFLCDCGNHVELRGDSSSKSCKLKGCTVNKNRRNTESNTRLYKIWDGIKSRTINNNHHSAKNYHNRGISLCLEWREFSNFKSWALKNNYSDDLTIDRKNIDKDYSPNNCEWITREENTRRQISDGHGNQKSVKLTNKENTLVFISIAEASRYISKFTPIKFKSICASLENRLKNNSTKPYKGYVVTIG